MATEKDTGKADTMSGYKNIYQRIHAVMQAVDYVQKEKKKDGIPYRFVSHDAVTAAIRPELVKEGVIYFPQELVYKQDGNRTEVTLNLHFVCADKPEDKLVVPSFGFGIDNQDKGPGKAVSYAIKYALLKTFGLETGDDPETDSIEHKKPEAKQKPKEAATFTRFMSAEERMDWLHKAGQEISALKNFEEIAAWEKENEARINDLGKEKQLPWIEDLLAKQRVKTHQAPFPKNVNGELHA